MGQNKQMHNADDQALDAFVNLTGEYSVSVHCALDASVANRHLFWRLSEIVRAWLHPRPRATLKNTYNVGLLQGLGNITVQLNPPHDNICFIQYYTRIYSEAHKDRHKFFQDCFMSQTLADKVSAKIAGVDLPPANQRSRLLTKEVIDAYLNSVLEVSRNPAEARVEIVYCSVERFETLSAFVHHAFAKVEEFRLQEPAVSWSLCVPIDCEAYYNRINIWMTLFRFTITRLTCENIYASESLYAFTSFSCVLIKQIWFTAKVNTIVNSKNPYLIPTDDVLKPEDFHSALIVEVIMSMILKGSVGRGAGGFWREFLGLTPQILQIYRNEELFSPWPFKNIRHVIDGEQHRLIINRQDPYDELIDRSISLNWDDLCNKLVKSRMKFLDVNRTNLQRMNDARKIAYYVLRIILLLQTRSTKPTAKHEYTIQEILLETLPLRRSVTYLSCKQFVLEKLHGGRERGFFPSLSILFEIIDHLVTEINLRHVQPREPQTFLNLLVNEICNAIKEARLPLRFTYGANTEFVVILEVGNVDDNTCIVKVWKEALRFASKFRRSFAALKVDQLILSYINWREANPSSRTPLTKVAEAIQQLFDNGALNPGIRIPNSLKVQLLQFANQEICE